MAQLAIAALGAAIGGATLGTGVVAFGLTGTAIGWTLGSIAGSFLAPTQRTRGPRLEDLRVTGGEYGAAIPWIAGHPRIAGQVWWASDRREISTTTSVGKGGGGAEYTSYTYEVDLLIGLCDVEIAGVSRIWLNGKLIWSALESSPEDTWVASAESDLWSRITVYSGAADQLPDHTYEAVVGVGNAPAYRGRGTVFIESLQLGSSGALPNLTFEVCRTATSAYTELWLKDLSSYDRTITATGSVVVPSTSPARFGQAAALGGTAGYFTADGADGGFDGHSVITAEAWVYATAYTGTNRGIINNLVTTGLAEGWALNITSSKLAGRVYTGNVEIAVNAVDTFPLNQWVFVALHASASTVAIYQDGVLVGTATNTTGGIGQSGGDVLIGSQTRFSYTPLSGYIDDVRVSSVSRSSSVPTSRFPEPDADVLLLWRCDARDLLTPGDEPVQDVVEALCARSGMDAATYDASALASITRPVRGLTAANVTSARSVLDMLAGAYFFDAYLADKMYFVPRGGGVALSVANADMGAGADQPAPETLQVTIASETELPAQMALTYANADGDYNPATEYSDRLLSGVVSTSAVQLPLAMTAAEAKGVADAMLQDAYAGRITGQVSLPQAYSRLVPSDVVTLTADDGTTYRARLVRRVDDGQTIGLEWVLDDASALVSAGITSSDYTPTITVSLPGATDMAVMDAPLLRDADDTPGLYAAVKPATATTWPGAKVYSSPDGVEYADMATASSRAVFGLTTTALTSYTGGNVFDQVGTVTVDVGAGTLASATRDAVLDSSANAMLVGSEVIQFTTATYVSAGVYTLTGLLRGRRGTEWAMTGHAIGEVVVLLRTAGLLTLNHEAARIGLAQQFKAVTLGKTLASAAAQTVTDTGVRLKPWAVQGLRYTLASGTLTVTWERRTRLSYRWPASAAAPLGEDAEEYDVELRDTMSALVSTQTTATNAATFSGASVVSTWALPLAYLQTVAGDTFGVFANVYQPHYVLEVDTAGAQVQGSPVIGQRSKRMLNAGGYLYVLSDYTDPLSFATITATKIERFDPADLSTATHTYTGATAGDIQDIYHDGTTLWAVGYTSGNLFGLTPATLTLTSTTAVTTELYRITGDGTLLYMARLASTNNYLAYDPVAPAIDWQVTLGNGSAPIHLRNALVYAEGRTTTPSWVRVLDATDGSTLLTHEVPVVSLASAPAFVDFGDYVVFLTSGAVAYFLDATDGSLAFTATLGSASALAGALSDTLYVLEPDGSGEAGQYVTKGYQIVPDLTGYTVTVYQVSATVGRGYPASITL